MYRAHRRLIGPRPNNQCALYCTILPINRRWARYIGPYTLSHAPASCRGM